MKLGERYPLSCGLSGVIEGSLPIGGLSSSAAVALVYLKALCHVNLIQPEPIELIMISVAAENDYVGVNSGKLDQSCEVYSKKDHLLYLDTKTDEYELIPTSPKMKPYRIAIFFSGIERTLAGSKFNMRVDEARSAAYALMAYAGMEYGKFPEANLRAVPREVYEQYKDRLPATWRRRAEHWYTEFDRNHVPHRRHLRRTLQRCRLQGLLHGPHRPGLRSCHHPSSHRRIPGRLPPAQRQVQRPHLRKRRRTDIISEK